MIETAQHSTSTNPITDDVIKAERIALGAMIGAATRAENDLVHELIDAMGGRASLAIPLHRRVFDAVLDLHQAGDGVPTQALLERLQRDRGANLVADTDSLVEICDSFVGAGDGLWHARHVADHAFKRRVVSMADQLVRMGANGSTPDEVLEAIDSLASIGRTVKRRGPDGAELLTVGQLRESYNALHPAVIDGLIREGETANIIAASKVGKSWLAYYIGLCIVTGACMFDAFDCAPGRVLLIDNELHRPTIAHRIPRVADAMGLAPSEYADRFDVLPLRGVGVSIADLRRHVDRIEAGTYKAIIADAWYRFIPSGLSENSNADVMSMYNLIDTYAAATRAAWIVIHHSSKGSQADKAVTDVGSGAGAQSRAADAHLVLRDHEHDGHVVLDAAVRSFPPVVPLGLRWDFPIWRPVETLDTSALKGRKTASERRQDERDAEGMQTIRDALADGPLTERQIRAKTGFGKTRAERLLDRMTATGDLATSETTINGNSTHEFRLAL